MQATGDNAPVARSEKKMPVTAAAVANSAKAGSRTNAEADMEPAFIPEMATGIRQQAVNSMMMSGNAGSQLGLAAGDRAQIQHTIHDLEPLSTYSMRVIAVNAIGQSRPSVALSLRTEEEGEFSRLSSGGPVVCLLFSLSLQWFPDFS